MPRAITEQTGFTAITTQAMWKDHPEKVCAFTEEFAETNPKTVKAPTAPITVGKRFLRLRTSH